jgi:hypothetical protein
MLENLCELKTDECHRSRVYHMAHVSHNPELSAGCAANVQLYETFMREFLDA